MKNAIRVSLLILVGMLGISCGETKKKSDDGVAEEVDEALSVEGYEEVTENKERSALDLVMGDTEFSTLTKGLKSVNLVDSLQSKKPITLFAPTNDAFAKLPEEKVNDFMAPQGKNDLISILKYHIVDGKRNLTTLKSEVSENNGTLKLKTLQGNTLRITEENGQLLLTDHLGAKARIIRPNLEASQDIVQGIDMVLRPK